MELIDKTIAARNETQYAGRIPKVIYQTFEDASVPEGMHAAAMSWVKANPGYAYRFHDAKDRAEFIAEFDREVFTAYNKLTYGAFKADLWRYCILYARGGIYSDIDTFCVNSLDYLVDPTDEFIVPRDKPRPAVFNAFICSRPGHPFLEAAISRATRLIHEGRIEDGFETTGPVNLGSAMNICLGRSEKSPHVLGTHTFADTTYRIIAKRHPTKELPGHVVAGETVLFLNKYKGYMTDLKKIGVHHWATRSVLETIAAGVSNPRKVRKWIIGKINNALR